MSEGGGFGVAAGAVLAMGRNWSEGMGEGEGAGRARLFERLHQIPFVFQIPISSGSGVYQMNDLLMPKAGYMWSVRNFVAQGYSAGSVSAYKGPVIAGGALIGTGQAFPFSAAGVATIGRGELLLDQGDALVFAAGTAVPGGTAITLVTGFAGVQINGSADCFERWLLPEYLGLGQK